MRRRFLAPLPLPLGPSCAGGPTEVCQEQRGGQHVLPDLPRCSQQPLLLPHSVCTAASRVAAAAPKGTRQRDTPHSQHRAPPTSHLPLHSSQHTASTAASTQPAVPAQQPAQQPAHSQQCQHSSQHTASSASTAAHLLHRLPLSLLIASSNIQQVGGIHARARICCCAAGVQALRQRQLPAGPVVGQEQHGDAASQTLGVPVRGAADGAVVAIIGRLACGIIIMC